jgi:hypothetical protein
MTKEIPLLQADDIECRIQSVTKSNKPGAILLLYKNARTDMRILDEVYGPMNWQRTHAVIDGKLFCSIDIWDDEKKTWIRKQDVGTESNTEAEKGQASDSFKRAGTNVGIGRELYTAPFIYVELKSEEVTNGKANYKAKFKVSSVGYNEKREINQLTIVDRNNNERFNFGTKIRKAKTSSEQVFKSSTSQVNQPVAKKASQHICSECGKEIKGNAKASATQVVQGTLKTYGRELCLNCATKAAEERQTDNDKSKETQQVNKVKTKEAQHVEDEMDQYIKEIEEMNYESNER